MSGLLFVQSVNKPLFLEVHMLKVLKFEIYSFFSPTMSDDVSSGGSSPSKKWVQFNEDGNEADVATNGNTSTSSGVSSARGSVNSLQSQQQIMQQQQQQQQQQQASLDVSEVQVGEIHHLISRCSPEQLSLVM